MHAYNVLQSTKNLLAKRRFQQVLALYSSLITGLLVSIAVSVINTRALGADFYGDYKFLQAISMFVVSLSTLGIFVSTGRILAELNEKTERRAIIGASSIIMLFIFVVFSIGFWVFSYYQYDYFDRDLGWLIRLSLPLTYGYILKIYLENVLKGVNGIFSLAFTRVAPNIFYLLYAAIMVANDALDLTSAYLGFIFCTAAALTIILLQLRPVFSNIRTNITRILTETREYGFNVYLGILASVASIQLGGVMVAYFLDTRSAGFFLLARTITMPLVQISTSIGTAFFRSFAKKEFIPRRVMFGTLGMGAGILIVFILIIGDFVNLVYPPEFQPIIRLCYIMALGATLQGIAGMINNFLCARGHGAYSRNASFARGFINCIGYTLGIQYYGITGAACTVLASGLFFLLAMLYYYRKAVANSDQTA